MLWVRSFSQRGGFMLELEARDVHYYQSSEYMSRLQSEIAKLPDAKGERSQRPMEVLCLPATKANFWENGRRPIVFSISQTSNSDEQLLVALLKRLATVENIEIAQHETVLHRAGTRRIFRAYGNPGLSSLELTNRVRYQFESCFENCTTAKPSLKFGPPHAHEAVRYAQTTAPNVETDHWLYTISTSDRAGLYWQAFELLLNKGLTVTRSSCRAMVGHATLLFTVTPNRTHDRDHLVSVLETIRLELQTKTRSSEESIRGRCDLHRLDGSPYQCIPHHQHRADSRIGVIHLRFRENSPDLLRDLLTPWYQASPETHGSTAVFMVDGQPAPESPETFSCRLGFMANSLDHVKQIFRVTNKFVIDRAHSDGVESCEFAFDHR
jgi:hypothetical protein